MSSKEKARRDKSKNKNQRKNMIKEKFYEEEPEDILSNGDYENAFHKKQQVIEEEKETNQDKPTQNEGLPNEGISNEGISNEEEFNDDYFKQEIVK